MTTRVSRFSMKTVTSYALAAAIAAIGFVTPVGAVRSQEPRRLVTPDSVPLELVAALVTAGGFPGEPQILVGSMPEWITNRLYVPANARVLGSAFLGTTVVGIVSLPAASDTVIAEFKRELLRRGWQNPPPPAYSGGGFRSAPTIPDGPTTRLTLCADQQTLTATASRRRGTVTNVTFRVFSSAGFSVCHPPQLQAGMGRSPFPTLINPPTSTDARMTGDCSSTLMGSSGTSTTLRTPMPADALLDHYGKQLQDSGWAVSGEKASIVGRTWTRADSAGAPVETVITVATPARDVGCRELNLQVRTLRKP
jgi:hypothetical protein